MVSYELRPEHAQKGRANLESFHGEVPTWVELRDGDVRDVASTGEVYDRVVLDVPEPWGALDAVSAVLRPGGIFLGYLPTTVQVQTFVLELQRAGYRQVETLELLQRTWHVTERSVRPDHRMVGHTEFITFGRRAAPNAPPDEGGRTTRTPTGQPTGTPTTYRA